jgi:predicted lipoprotein with Yx(FWY)xxD motif
VQTRRIGVLAVPALAAVIGVSAAFASPAMAPVTVKTAKVANLGNVLVNGSGLTLYRYTPDKKGTSVCTGACAKYWPPLLVTGKAKPVAGTGVTASKLGVIKRSNGQMQVTYGGYPLYRYSDDSKTGQAKGQGEESAWYAVATSGALVKTSVQAAAPTSSPSSSSGSPAPATTTAPAGGGGYDY